MEKIMNRNELFAEYKKTAKTDCFIFGGIVGDTVKFIYTDINTVFETTTIQETSNKYGKCEALRIHFSGTVKAKTKKDGITIATVSEFEYLLENPIDGKSWNKGELFEYLVYRYHGMQSQWHRTNGKHSTDISINGIEYQIKTDRAWMK